jgi:hypothetical protein
LFCGYECTIVEIDPDNCGACGVRCNPGEVCSQGMCGADCTGGTTRCGDVCVNLNTDQQNCGACGNACQAGEVCDGNGNCQLVCPGGMTECNGTCVNTNTDPLNCGSCGNACTGGQICDGQGQCATNCQANLVLCGTICIDPLTNEDHCGASGDCLGANAGDACGQAEVCENGDCQAVTCNDQWEQNPGDNDTETTATVLSVDPIGDCASAVTESGVINGGEDVDWYTYEGDDGNCWVNPLQSFNQASDDARLCAFFECVDPNATTQFTCPMGTTNATSPQGRFGCCETSSTASFEVDDLNCTGTINEDIYVYIRVDDPAGTPGTCTSYVIEYNY